MGYEQIYKDPVWQFVKTYSVYNSKYKKKKHSSR